MIRDHHDLLMFYGQAALDAKNFTHWQFCLHAAYALTLDDLRDRLRSEDAGLKYSGGLRLYECWQIEQKHWRSYN